MGTRIPSSFIMAWARARSLLFSQNPWIISRAKHLKSYSNVLHLQNKCIGISFPTTGHVLSFCGFSSWNSSRFIMNQESLLKKSKKIVFSEAVMLYSCHEDRFSSFLHEHYVKRVALHNKKTKDTFWYEGRVPSNHYTGPYQLWKCVSSRLEVISEGVGGCSQKSSTKGVKNRNRKWTQ
jgi:hypothetical protein